MWSFSFVVPTLMILIIILAFYFSLPRLPINKNRYFVTMMLIEAFTVIMDMVSSYVDNNYQQYSVGLVNIVNMLYFLSYFARALIIYEFTAGVLGVTLGKSKVIKYILRIPFYFSMVLTVLSMFWNIIYYVDENGYHAGEMYIFLYYCGFFYILMSFLAVSRYHKRLSGRREKYSMILYNLIVLAGLIMRLLLPTYLLMDTFVLMAVIVVYLAFENPEYYLELKSSVFNSRALREYLEEHSAHMNDRCLGLVVHRYYEMRDIYGATQTDAGMNMLGKYLVSIYPKGKIFYYRKGRFVILGNSDAEIKELSRTISERFKQPWKSSEAEIYFDVGFAIIELSDRVESTDVLLNTITRALVMADMSDSEIPLDIKYDELLATEQEMKAKRSLEAAIDLGNVELFLQPMFDAKLGKIAGAEALARIRDEKGNLLPPSSFIKIAEKNGRINEIGEQIFEKTCKFIKEHDPKKYGVEWINVNLSPVQFVRKDIAERYAYIAGKYNVDPAMIHLEITEEAMIDVYFLNRQIRVLAEKGFKFVLDDYGTGYSNLARLKKCPFINIKIDMSIVWDYCKEPDHILPTMVQAFKHMGFDITSEGVEDDNMAETMKNIGCDFLQGYLYSKPLPVEEFVKQY
ncbi:MAG: EAL domain-containing protein, partial [Lachnospiraceae bacterium]|nr:EAL domain-containing protein [Lachnospiraceae bacterium]